jgi:transposase
MDKKIAHLGIDYHPDSVTIAVLVQDKKDFYDTLHMANNDKVISKYLNKLSKHFELKLCYEASSSGYTFQRKVASWGYQCDVIAPSLVPKKRGERRKNDFRDARELAQLYAKGLLTVVHPPSEEQEAVRSLIRCRLAFKASVKRGKHQINSLLLSHNFRWSRTKWTNQHRQWLGSLQMPHDFLQQSLNEYLSHLDYLETCVERLDEQIEQLARCEIYAPSVKKLRAFKGIGTLTAMVLIAEITDFRRFPNPRALMAFLGLIPSENSSAGKQKGGSITKTGNIRCRTHLIESMQHYSKNPRLSQQMKHDLSQVDARSALIAINCLNRLHKRYWSLIVKGKLRPVALVAIAREFVGFVWAMMHPEQSAVPQSAAA